MDPPQTPSRTSFAHNLDLSSEQTKVSTVHPEFPNRLQYLSRRLLPILSLSTGTPHPSFPRTILAYHLLTAQELNDMAHYYHQRTPCRLTFEYPVSVDWDPATAANQAMIARGEISSEQVAQMRRRFGRFIGLRGCNSPTMEQAQDPEEIRRRLEREWIEGLRRQEEEDAVRRKFGGRRGWGPS